MEKFKTKTENEARILYSRCEIYSCFFFYKVQNSQMRGSVHKIQTECSVLRFIALRLKMRRLTPDQYVIII